MRGRPAGSRKLRTQRHPAWLAIVGADRFEEGRFTRREWGPEDLIACWTLVEADWLLVANKSAATRLGFALVLKLFELEGRFPRHAGDLPAAAVDYVLGQVEVDPGVFSHDDFSNRTAKYHRAQIRGRARGFVRPLARTRSV